MSPGLGGILETPHLGDETLARRRAQELILPLRGGIERCEFSARLSHLVRWDGGGGAVRVDLAQHRRNPDGQRRSPPNSGHVGMEQVGIRVLAKLACVGWEMP